MNLEEKINFRIQLAAISFYIEKITDEKAQKCYLEAFQQELDKITEEGEFLFNLDRFYNSHRSKLEKIYLDGFK